MIKKIWRKYFHSYEVYTDGSHKGKWGAWAFVVIQKKVVLYEKSNRERKTNSQRMEFQAAIEAIKSLPAGSFITIFSDYKVLIDTAQQNWVKKPNASTINLDQVQELKQLTKNYQISWQWIKAHSGITYNERCDQLCIAARTAYCASTSDIHMSLLSKLI